MWVISAVLTVGRPLPVRPQERTWHRFLW